MSTSLVDPKRRGRKLNKLTTAQQTFCHEMAADPQFNGTAAARKAGYKHPPQAANKLLNTRAVQAYLGKVLHERQERCQLTADEVLEHLGEALFLDPLELFSSNPEGTITVKSLDDVPIAVRRCITKIKSKKRVTQDGATETTLEIELMSKDAAMTNAMKHLGLLSPDGTNVNLNVGGSSIDFDELCQPPVLEGT